jgi:DNA gyrase subunit A
VVIAYTANGTIRKLKPKSYEKALEDEEPTIKNIFKFSCKLDSDKLVYAFTNKGNLFKLDISFIPESKGSDINGIHFGKVYKEAEVGEEPVAFFSETDIDFEKGRIAFFTKQGFTKVSLWSDYNLVKSTFSAIKLKDGDELVAVVSDKEENEVMIVTSYGFAIRFDNEIPVQGRTAGGVKGVNLTGVDYVISATEYNKDECNEIVVGSSEGKIKKVSIGTIKKINRGGRGDRIIDLSDDFGATLSVFAVINAKGTRIYSIGEDGISSCTDTDLPLESRLSAGKRIAKLGKATTLYARAKSYK